MRKSKLEDLLKGWAGQGLITAAQAAAIWEFEAKRPARSWVLYGIAGVGITAIAAGIVSIVAANWFRIPPEIKIINYFIAQSLMGFAVAKLDARWRSRITSGGNPTGVAVAREAALMLFGLMFFAGIGLVGQIYNLSGALWKSLGFWSLLALPSALFCHRVWFGFIWIGVALTAGADLAFNFERHMSHEAIALRGAIFTAVIILLMLPGAVRNWKEWAVGTGLARAATYTGILSFFLAGSVYGNIGWYVTRPFLDELNLRRIYLVPPWLAIALVALAAIVRRDWPARVRQLAAVALCVAGVYYSVPFLYAVAGSHPLLAKVLGAAGFVLIWTCIAVVAAVIDRRWMFELAALCIALRFLVIYFEVFGSLAATGVGLIISGVVILGVAWGWYRYKNSLRQRIGAAGGGSAT